MKESNCTGRRTLARGVAAAGARTILLCAGASTLPHALGQGGAYSPGNLRNREDLEIFLTPPGQVEVEEGYWRVEEGIELFHFADGDGDDVLFLHGGPGFPPDEVLKGLHLLADRYRFHYYHQRGCGLSTRPFDRFESGNFLTNMMSLLNTLGIEQQIADIDRIRRILGRDRFTLVGHSFGGFIAALEAEGLPTSDALLSEGYNSGWMPFAIYFSLGMQYDHTTALSRISCPVLVIHAEDDITMTSEGIRSYIDNIDNTVLEIIEDAGHHSFNDRPEEFAGIVSEFLASGHR